MIPATRPRPGNAARRATREDIAAALAGVVELGGGPWTAADLAAGVRQAFGDHAADPFDAADLADEVSAARIRGELEVCADGYRIPAAKVAASSLGVAICRVLGEASERMGVDAISRALRKAGLYPSDATLRATLAALVPAYVTGDAFGYHAAHLTMPAPVPVALPRPAFPPVALPSLADALAAAVASGTRTTRRSPLPLDESARAEIEAARTHALAEIDRVVATAKREVSALRKSVRRASKHLAQGHRWRRMTVVMVPDFARNLLCRYEVASEGQPTDPPRLVSSRKLPHAIRRAATAAAAG